MSEKLVNSHPSPVLWEIDPSRRERELQNVLTALEHRFKHRIARVKRGPTGATVWLSLCDDWREKVDTVAWPLSVVSIHIRSHLVDERNTSRTFCGIKARAERHVGCQRIERTTTEPNVENGCRSCFNVLRRKLRNTLLR